MNKTYALSYLAFAIAGVCAVGTAYLVKEGLKKR